MSIHSIKTNKKYSGFTLIELLVVIAIIGILTTLVTSNLTLAQARGRDSKRKSDLRTIATGLEMYYSDYNAYPSHGTSNGQLALPSGNQLTNPSASPANIYIKQMPKDPKNDSTNNYIYRYCVNSTGKNFNLYANLENNNDPERFCGGTAFSSTCGQVTTNCGSSPTFTQSNYDYTVSEP